MEFVRLPRDVVVISGADRLDFLQGLISQDVARVGESTSAYAALLTPQGKYLHDFILVACGEVLLADCEGGRGDDFTTRLSRFRLRANVALATDTRRSVIAVIGDGAAAAFGLEPTTGATLRFGSAVALVDPRSLRLGVRLIGDEETLAHLVTARGLTEAPFATYDRLRIACEAPDGSRDMDIEKSTLLESNIDRLGGIDWEKGCYMGQELTARTRYRGLVKRQLAAFRATHDDQGPGTPVMQGDSPVGEIRSRAHDHVLASVRREALDDPESAFSAAGHPIERLPI
jgi:folate-binding protein YgfZ